MNLNEMKAAIVRKCGTLPQAMIASAFDAMLSRCTVESVLMLVDILLTMNEICNRINCQMFYKKNKVYDV